MNTSEQPTEKNIVSLFSQWFATMAQQQVGIINDVDSEYLHDYRVALRKIRSLLSQLRPLLPGATAQHLQQEFSWLAELTSPLRDLDVYLQALPDCRRRLPRKLRAELEVFEHYLRELRLQAYCELQNVFASERYQSLQTRWSEFLHQDEKQEAFKGLQQQLQQQLGKRYRKFLASAKKLRRVSSAEEFHEFRIFTKKLRYTFEFMFSADSNKKVNRFAGALKKLQDRLGEMHDLNTMLSFVDRYQAELITDMDSEIFLWQALARLRNVLVIRYHKKQKSVLRVLRKLIGRKQQNKFSKLCNFQVVQ